MDSNELSNKLCKQLDALATNGAREGLLALVRAHEIRHIDARHLKCPEPLMLLHAATAEQDANSLILLEAQDAGTLKDIPEFCRHLDYPLLAQQEIGGAQVFLISALTAP